MHKIREHRLRQSRVTAVFEDRALSFILGKGATLEELSDRLADLDRRHHARPLAITVKFGSSSPKAVVNRISRSAGVSGRVDGLRQRMEAENSEHANVEHNTG
jgi:hypothetical protein